MIELPLEQYRRVVAHMMYWRRGIDEAMRDSGITILKKEVIDQLFEAGYIYDEKKDSLEYIELGE